MSEFAVKKHTCASLSQPLCPYAVPRLLCASEKSGAMSNAALKHLIASSNCFHCNCFNPVVFHQIGHSVPHSFLHNPVHSIFPSLFRQPTVFCFFLHNIFVTYNYVSFINLRIFYRGHRRRISICRSLFSSCKCISRRFICWLINIIRHCLLPPKFSEIRSCFFFCLLEDSFPLRQCVVFQKMLLNSLSSLLIYSNLFLYLVL